MLKRKGYFDLIARCFDIDSLTKSRNFLLSRLVVYLVPSNVISVGRISRNVAWFTYLQDLIKAIAMGRDFCRHKVELCDALIITVSFVIDIVFVGGLSDDEGGKAAIVLVLLLLWRIARVVDGTRS